MISTAAIRVPLTRVVFASWIALMAGLSIAPDRIKRRLHTTGHFHYLGHVVIFAITAAVVTCTAKTLRSRVLRAGCIVAFGITLESAEVIAYHGWFEKRDLLADVAGVFLGLLLTCTLPNHTSAVPSER
jgi:hypothetical protein